MSLIANDEAGPSWEPATQYVYSIIIMFTLNAGQHFK